MSDDISPAMKSVREKAAAFYLSLTDEERAAADEWAVIPKTEEPPDKWTQVFMHIADAMGLTAPWTISQRNIAHAATNEICEFLDKEQPLIDTYWIYHTVMNAVGTQFTEKFRGYSQHIIDVTNKAVTAIVETYFREGDISA